MALFSDIFDEVNVVLDTYVVDTSTSLVDKITPIFTSMLIVWVAIWGIMMMMGKTENTLQEAFFKILRVGFILTLGLSVGTYNAVIVDFIFGWPEEILAWIIGNTSGSIVGTIDTLFSTLAEIAKAAWEKGGVFNGNVGYYLIALVIGGFGVLIAVLLAFLILLSKIVLSILLAIGPIFIVLLLFNTTQKFFESWMAALLNYGFLLLLSVLVALLVVSIVNTMIAGFGAPDSLATLYGAMKVSVLLLLSILVLRQTPQLAANLGGGIAIQTAGAMTNAVNQSKNFSKYSGLNMGTREAGRGFASLGRAAYQKAFSPRITKG